MSTLALPAEAVQAPEPTAVADRIWPAVLGAWVVAALVLTIFFFTEISRQDFLDPDDTMRLLQVRAWLDGQSWWDVDQHKLNGGDFRMHWSRLVDLPIAALLVVLRPLLGPYLAESVAMTVVPLLSLLGILTLVTVITRRMLGVAAAWDAAPLAALTIPILMQVLPLRIDHHAWQILWSLAALAALLHGPGARQGALTGLSLAALVTVSLEGLPVAAAVAGAVALAWALKPERWRGTMLACAWALFGGALLLHLATRGPHFLAHACDAVSPAWLLALGVAAGGVTAASALGGAAPLLRLSALGLATAATGGALLMVAPDCLRGPFGTLDPLVRDVWYMQVLEGRPLWEQRPSWAAAQVAAPLIGFAGCVFGWRNTEGAARERWGLLLMISAAAFIVSIGVLRAGGVANAFALPGVAAILTPALARVRRMRSILPRAVGSATAILAVSPGLFIASAFHTAPGAATAEALAQDAGAERTLCKDSIDMRAVGRLPASVLFLPLDVSPEVIAATPHRAIAGGYHRNVAAIHRVISAFTGPVDRAERLVRETGARYVAVCPGLPEPEVYRQVGPDGLWARLERGERVSWLRSVPMPGTPVLVWEVTPAS